MGWWSDDIMGGDTPLDLQSFIYDALGLEQYPNDRNKELIIPADGYDYKKIVKYLKDRDGDDYWLKSDTGNIFHQVLGVMMMNSGATINKTLKAKMIKAAKNDEWANEGLEDNDEGRRDKMDAFITKLKAYDGNPTVIESKGLMETIFKGIASEEPKVFSKQQVIYCVSEVAAKLGYTPTSDKMKEFNLATIDWMDENEK